MRTALKRLISYDIPPCLNFHTTLQLHKDEAPLSNNGGVRDIVLCVAADPGRYFPQWVCHCYPSPINDYVTVTAASTPSREVRVVLPSVSGCLYLVFLYNIIESRRALIPRNMAAKDQGMLRDFPL